MRKRLGSLLLPAFLAVYILFFLGTVDGRLSGDDHAVVWVAAALQAGDRLYVDVFDSVQPMQVALSYIGQSLSGSTPLGEIAIALTLRLIGLTAIYFITRRLSASRLAAVSVSATVALLLLSDSVYGAEKVAIYPVAILAMWWYIDRGVSPLVLSVVIACAALFRHDHGIYVAIPIAIAVFFRPRPIRALFIIAAGVIVLMLPWILWVQHTEGLWTYLTSRAAHSLGSGLSQSRPFGFRAPYLWAENAPRWLWHVAALTSAGALIVSLRTRNRHVGVLAIATIAAQFGLMRKAGQAADVSTLWIPLFAWLVRVAPPYGKVLLAGVGAVSIAAIITMTNATERIPQIVRDGGGLFHRPFSALELHSTSPPIDAYAPREDTDDERLIIRYVYQCTRSVDRLWNTSSWFPLSYYSQRRPVWHVYWDLGMKRDDASQTQFLKWLPQLQVPVIVTRGHDDPLDAFKDTTRFARMWRRIIGRRRRRGSRNSAPRDTASSCSSTSGACRTAGLNRSISPVLLRTDRELQTAVPAREPYTGAPVVVAVVQGIPAAVVIEHTRILDHLAVPSLG